MKSRRLITAALIGSLGVAAWWAGSLGSPDGVTEALLVTVPVWCAALSAALPLKTGLYNLGAEGQIYMGATAAAAMAALFDSQGASGPVAIAGCLLAASLGGAILGWAAGLARARLGMNEAVVTILLNFMAIALARFAAAGPLRDPESFGYPWTSPIPDATRIGFVTPVGLRVPWGVALAASAAATAWILLYRTRAGLDLRAIGSNARAAEFVGIDLPKRRSQVMAVAGSIAGFGGGLELLGHQFRLSPFFSPGLGFSGLVAAVISQSAGPLLAVTSFLLAAVRTGLQTTERLIGIPSAVSYIIQGSLLAAAALAGARRGMSGRVTLRVRRRRPLEA